jgi:ATP/maltotriose-dependent transcriptional regulator MalT
VSPVFAGHVYCTMIEGCQEVSDYGRAAEWTAALSRWCDAQPGLVLFTGQCAVHRGQIMRLRGAFEEALAEFAAAADRYRQLGEVAAAGLAQAERGDVLRMQGRFAEAEDAYEQAGAVGFEPLPGLALLWLAQGRSQAAQAAVRRLLAEVGDPVARSRLLPPAVDVLLAVDDAAAATDLVGELAELAARFKCAAVQASAAQASGRLQLETGDPAGALPYLRKAVQLWQSVKCPYETARVQVLIGRACAALGDLRSSTGQMESARRTFTDLGAAPALDEVLRLTEPDRPPGGLTAREVEVLRLVAAGRSNAQIATELVLSERTVARHLSNIFDKLHVPSRTAAAAYAYEHGLA